MTATEPPSAAAFAFGRTRDWPGYFRAVEGGEPRQTLLDALTAFQGGGNEPGFAIDLGCGEGRDTAELLRRGWRVLAIDGHPDGLDRLSARDDLLHADRLTTQLATFEELETLPPCDLVNASFALAFCQPSHFDELWRKVTAAVRPGGRFAGQVFGDRDTWASIADRSHFTRAQTEQLFDGFVLESLREEEKDATDSAGNAKHWHVFHVVARKRDGTTPNDNTAEGAER
ncbi:MAG: class I SAM-dependent methyltransferase [Planctomycetota bacterium]